MEFNGWANPTEGVSDDRRCLRVVRTQIASDGETWVTYCGREVEDDTVFCEEHWMEVER